MRVRDEVRCVAIKSQISSATLLVVTVTVPDGQTTGCTEEVCDVLLITCRHHHRAAPADSMAVVKSAAVITRKNG